MDGILQAINKSCVVDAIPVSRFDQDQEAIMGERYVFPEIAKHVSKHADECDFIWHLGNSSFIWAVMFHDNPTITLKSNEAVEKAIRAYKHDMVKSMSDEREFYKVFGFGRRRNIKMDDLIAIISAPAMDSIITVDVMNFVAKFANKKIIVYDMCTHTKEIMNPECEAGCMFIKKIKSSYKLGIVKESVQSSLAKCFKTSPGASTVSTMTKTRLKKTCVLLEIPVTENMLQDITRVLLL